MLVGCAGILEELEAADEFEDRLGSEWGGFAIERDGYAPALVANDK